MVEYFNQFTMNEFVTIYCLGMLGMIVMILSMGLLIVIALNALDILSELWYTTKAKRTIYKKL